jgi:restriction endonuclease Mrr
VSGDQAGGRSEEVALPTSTALQSLTLRALRELGGEAERHAIKRRAIELGDFSPAQLARAAPPSKRKQYPNQLEYRLSWALHHLNRQGAVERVRRGVWRLVT